MAARLLPAAFVLSALALDGRGLHGLAFYLLVASVPAAAVSALFLFGCLAELPGGARGEAYLRLEAALAGLGLVLLLLAAAVWGQAPAAAALPALTASALAASLAVYTAQSLAALAAPRPPSPRAAPAEAQA